MFEDDRGVLYEDVGVYGHLVDVRCSYFLNQRRSYDAMRYIGVTARVGEPNQNMARQQLLRNS